MPEHPKALLRRLVELMGLLVDELRLLCLNENIEKGAPAVLERFWCNVAEVHGASNSGWVAGGQAVHPAPGDMQWYECACFAGGPEYQQEGGLFLAFRAQAWPYMCLCMSRGAVAVAHVKCIAAVVAERERSSSAGTKKSLQLQELMPKVYPLRWLKESVPAVPAPGQTSR